MDDDRYRFAVGDIVRVAGIVSPRMKVSKIITDGGVLVECFWFNRRLEFQGLKFQPRFLAKASPWEDRPREPNVGATMADVIDVDHPEEQAHG